MGAVERKELEKLGYSSLANINEKENATYSFEDFKNKYITIGPLISCIAIILKLKNDTIGFIHYDVYDKENLLNTIDKVSEKNYCNIEKIYTYLNLGELQEQQRQEKVMSELIGLSSKHKFQLEAYINDQYPDFGESKIEKVFTLSNLAKIAQISKDKENFDTNNQDKLFSDRNIVVYFNEKNELSIRNLKK